MCAGRTRPVNHIFFLTMPAMLHVLSTSDKAYVSHTSPAGTFKTQEFLQNFDGKTRVNPFSSEGISWFTELKTLSPVSVLAPDENIRRT